MHEMPDLKLREKKFNIQSSKSQQPKQFHLKSLQNYYTEHFLIKLVIQTTCGAIMLILDASFLFKRLLHTCTFPCSIGFFFSVIFFISGLITAFYSRRYIKPAILINSVLCIFVGMFSMVWYSLLIHFRFFTTQTIQVIITSNLTISLILTIMSALECFLIISQKWFPLNLEKQKKYNSDDQQMKCPAISDNSVNTSSLNNESVNLESEKNQNLLGQENIKWNIKRLETSI